jgi:hypothetical protein
MKTKITKALSFDVLQLPCPHYPGMANLSSARTGILHTTEGHWDDAMDVFREHYAPHFLVGMKGGKGAIAQLLEIGVTGMACRGHNAAAIVQVEFVGYSEESLWLPGKTKRNPDAAALDALASLMEVCWEEWGIPLTHPFSDDQWPRYGKNPNRTAGKLGKVAGWYGHGDMPFPDVHWDPGHLQWTAVFQRAHELAAAEGAREVKAGILRDPKPSPQVGRLAPPPSKQEPAPSKKPPVPARRKRRGRA